MSKRLQVVVRDDDLERYELTANAAGLTLSEWVRRSLDAAQRSTSSRDVEAKLSAIRSAARHNYPEVDIETMLAEIEAGYRHPGGA